jgi:signal transduction histidine kinase
MPYTTTDSPYCSSALWAPLKTRKDTLGGILLGRMEGRPIFTANEQKLLVTLAQQSAFALENARLFAHTDEELARRVEELDAFAHTVAHDLKTPLATTIVYASILNAEWFDMEPVDVQSALTRIVQGGQKMTNIIDELLLLSSVRKEEVEPERLEMARIVRDALDRLSHMVEEYEAEVILSESWPCALGHAPWVEEVWVNYISNAIRYGGNPPRMELGADEQPGGMVRFWVRDNGAGLTPEKQARLFIPFTKFEQIRAAGHGLGLSIVHRIINKLRGEVGVESRAGSGSLFFFSLPRCN